MGVWLVLVLSILRRRRLGVKFYLTTAIDYSNAKPHLGTAYEKIGADTLARFRRLLGDKVYFQMGNDEHSMNVEKRARELGIEPKLYCDKMAEEFLSVWNSLGISPDRFIRTTDEDHVLTVQALIKRMRDSGDIVPGVYEGLYCVSCEAYIKESELVSGMCPHHQSPPQVFKEENLFFRLSKYGPRILEHFREDPSFVQPSSRYNELLEILEKGLEDISISRKGEGWGIPIPWDPSQRVYVWVDALINYVSGAGYASDQERFARLWPCDLHIVGKDITRFHGIIWPALLLSAGLSLPKRVFGHGFVRMAGQKLSKTLGMTLDIHNLVQAYSSDVIRYFLMREIPFDRDGDFSEERLLDRYNADLANDLGNLLQRTTTLLGRQEKGSVPKAQPDTQLFEGFDSLGLRVQEGYGSLMFHQALADVLSWISALNGYMASREPWTDYRNHKRQRAQETLANVVAGLRAAFVWLLPVMPHKATEGLTQLGIRVEDQKKPLWGQAADLSWLFAFPKLGEARTLFPKLNAG